MHPHRPTSATTRVRALLTVIGLAAGASACSSASSSANTTAAPSVAVTTTGASTTTGQETTTTAAAATTSTAAETTTTVPAVPVYPLTGVVVDDAATAARPALVVKIDNAPGARPQTGFNEADIVFEEIVNDNLTRFAMVFQSGGSDPVGPIRSGRIQDIDLFTALNHPLFAWSGGNVTVTNAINASDLINIGPSKANVYFRTRDKGAPHNLYSTTEALYTLTPPFAAPATQQFSYRAPGAPAAGTPSPGVAVALDSIDARWDWDAATGLYMRTMEGKPHMDAGSGQVSTNNVLVLVMDYLPGISDSPDAQTIGTGEAFVLTGGNAIHGTWARADKSAPFTLTADDGMPILLQPGRTFIELPRAGHTIIIPG
jgi:hypothetical protein